MRRIISNLNKISKLVVIMALVVATMPINIANAAPVTGRSIKLSNSSGAATGVTYTLTTAALPTATAVKSLKVQFCTTASGSCTAPAGFSSASSSLGSQPVGLGSASGWTVSTGSANELRVLNASNATAPSGAVTVVWNGGVNPTANNTTFYGRMVTYSDATWTTALDDGVVGLSTSQQIQVNLSVLETLTFCSGTSITGSNCGTIAGSTVTLGEASVSTPNSGTSVLAAATNGTTGYVISVNGPTLTSGANTISALATQTASSVGTSQFGLNLVANTTPSVGTAASGSGSAVATANYGTTNQYRYVTGDNVASASGPTNGNTFTVSYLANISGTTAPGAYTSNLTYIATATF